MKRGEVWLVGLDPSRGTEAAKSRPVVIVSSNASNNAVARLHRGVVTVVPLTSNIRTVYPFQVLVPADSGNGLSAPSKAQAEQVRALDHSRFVLRIGELSAELVAALDEALLIHLALL
ncbi:MAG: type II toxin-antitoxin system PemK/MazF family toxin [Cellulomonadaceae bacterium]|jgi:mRNA interferase MazF|nr:type II toxin-antitoxin system PemK/MazF family toxin [Cellulomonadaceae bacterium]